MFIINIYYWLRGKRCLCMCVCMCVHVCVCACVCQQNDCQSYLVTKAKKQAKLDYN